ncbi:kelch-like protein 18 [Drosophila teissieri]|uniref:kelch-like protein 18 n=1 Tax=Drosophila teissieri TaxID=7243 RepID=UPI001CB9EEE1|nr:kelch-like protein 18 [Drosophila teissieri]
MCSKTEMVTINNAVHGDKLPMEPQLKELSFRDFKYNKRMPRIFKDFRLPKQRSIVHVMKDFWLQKKHPDFLVRIGQQSFPCDRLVLMVYIDQVRRNKDQLELQLPVEFVRPEVFEVLHRWMTDQEPLLKRTGIVNLLIAADYLNIKQLSSQIWACLDPISGIDEHQAIQVAMDALPLRELSHLHYLMLQRIHYYFLIFASSVEFLALPIGSVSALLSSNDIRINSEAEVLYAAIRWLNHEWPTRKSFALELMEKVRLSRLPSELLRVLESPVGDSRVDRIIQLPMVKALVEKGNFDQLATDMDDGTSWYREIYEIFDVTLVPPRRFICHDLAPYHEPKPESPDQVFEYKDFLGYLGLLQTLPLDTLQLLETPL